MKFLKQQWAKSLFGLALFAAALTLAFAPARNNRFGRYEEINQNLTEASGSTLFEWEYSEEVDFTLSVRADSIMSIIVQYSDLSNSWSASDPDTITIAAANTTYRLTKAGAKGRIRAITSSSGTTKDVDWGITVIRSN